MHLDCPVFLISREKKFERTNNSPKSNQPHYCMQCARTPLADSFASAWYLGCVTTKIFAALQDDCRPHAICRSFIFIEPQVKINTLDSGSSVRLDIYTDLRRLITLNGISLSQWLKDPGGIAAPEEASIKVIISIGMREMFGAHARCFVQESWIITLLHSRTWAVWSRFCCRGRTSSYLSMQESNMIAGNYNATCNRFHRIENDRPSTRSPPSPPSLSPASHECLY